MIWQKFSLILKLVGGDQPVGVKIRFNLYSVCLAFRTQHHPFAKPHTMSSASICTLSAKMNMCILILVAGPSAP